MFEPISERAEFLANQVVDASIAVHRELGPGLLESAYEACLCYELSTRNVPFQRQCALPVVYRGVRVDAGLRIDVLVDEAVVVELKSVDRMVPVYEAQMLTYLKLTGCRLGLLINFNVPKLKDGIRRLVR